MNIGDGVYLGKMTEKICRDGGTYTIIYIAVGRGGLKT